jgi:lipopolysaccharide biosynthesis regulator YciM
MQSFAIALALTATLALAQKPKSQKELEAVKAMLAATTADAKIAAVEDLLSRYKDTEFKAIALTQAAQAEQAKGDQIAGINYANRAIEADKNNYQALVVLGQLTVQGVREFDLDKDERLGRASKAANGALAALKTAPKPNPQLTDDQWNGIKKDFESQAHETLGMVATVQKKQDVAVTEFKTSLEGEPTPDPGTMVRLASVYDDMGKFDDAAALLDKVAASNAPPAIKQVGQNEKARADKMKAAKK